MSILYYLFIFLGYLLCNFLLLSSSVVILTYPHKTTYLITDYT